MGIFDLRLFGETRQSDKGGLSQLKKRAEGNAKVRATLKAADSNSHDANSCKAAKVSQEKRERGDLAMRGTRARLCRLPSATLQTLEHLSHTFASGFVGFRFRRKWRRKWRCSSLDSLEVGAPAHASVFMREGNKMRIAQEQIGKSESSGHRRAARPQRMHERSMCLRYGGP